MSTHISQPLNIVTDNLTRTTNLPAHLPASPISEQILAHFCIDLPDKFPVQYQDNVVSFSPSPIYEQSSHLSSRSSTTAVKQLPAHLPALAMLSVLFQKYALSSVPSPISEQRIQPCSHSSSKAELPYSSAFCPILKQSSQLQNKAAPSPFQETVSLPIQFYLPVQFQNNF